MGLARWCRDHPRLSAGMAATVVVIAVLDAQADETSPTPRPSGSTVVAVPTAPDTPLPTTFTASTTTASATTSAPSGTGPAAAALASIPVKGRAPRTGYDRVLFGSAWTDDNDAASGHNGCDTRNDILRRDLTSVVLKANSNGCAVLTGRLHDPYTGRDIDFVRGRSSSVVQIDHVVALSDAWQKGAQQLGIDARVALANDPLNLLAVDGPSNQRKSDGDAATWLPPDTNYRCAYVARQIAVKAHYHLWMTPAERDASARVLGRCPGQAIPVALPIPLGGAPVAQASTAAPARATPEAPGVGPVSYANCDAVRAAGAAPLHRDDPGYSRSLDRDGDGVACEP